MAEVFGKWSTAFYFDLKTTLFVAIYINQLRTTEVDSCQHFSGRVVVGLTDYCIKPALPGVIAMIQAAVWLLHEYKSMVSTSFNGSGFSIAVRQRRNG